MAPAKKVATSKAPKKASSKSTTSSHPPWTDMIKECIAANPEDARHGVSRPQIKKFVEEKYKVAIGNAQITQLSKAIALGAEKNVFYLPKGLSGRVKLPPKTPKVVDDAKENKPTSKTSKAATTKTVAKPATKPGSRTKAVTGKSAIAKPVSGRKAPSSKTTAKAVPSTKAVKKQVPTAKSTKPAGRSSTTRSDSAVKKTYAGKKPTERKVKSSTSKGSTKKAATGASSTSKASRSKAASTKKASSKAASTSRTTKSSKRT